MGKINKLYTHQQHNSPVAVALNFLATSRTKLLPATGNISKATSLANLIIF